MDIRSDAVRYAGAGERDCWSACGPRHGSIPLRTSGS